MGWKIELHPKAGKELDKIEKRASEHKAIVDFLTKDVANRTDPVTATDKILVGSKNGLRRYRVGNHRLIFAVINEEKTVYIVGICQRQGVYDPKYIKTAESRVSSKRGSGNSGIKLTVP